MIRDDDAGVRVTTSEDDVAPFSAIDDKYHPQEHLHQFLAGNVRRKLH